MSTAQMTTADICARGQRLYDERLRDQLEPQHNGKYVVLDVETGEYELDANHLAASDRAWAKHPGASLFAVRVGYGYLARLGLSKKVLR